jgi:tetratricopeptide (TPR) repeat protein
MTMKRLLTGVLAAGLVGMLMVAGFGPTFAQDATPTPAPPPESEATPEATAELLDCPAFEGSERAVRTGYYLGEGEAYFASGQINSAIYSFSCAIQIDVQYVPAYMSRAAAYAQLRDYEAGILDYTRALQRQPELIPAINNRGILYIASLEYDEALADFNEVLSIDSSYTPGIINRGITSALQGDYVAAIEDLESAIEQSGLEGVLSNLRATDRPQDAPTPVYDRDDAQAYAILGIIYSAYALDNYRDYLYLTTPLSDQRIQAAAGALESRFSFELRLDDGTWLLVADFEPVGQ